VDGHEAEERGAVLNWVGGDRENAEFALGHDTRRCECGDSICKNGPFKIGPCGEYSPFLDATGCAKLRKFRRVSGIPKSPHCNSATRPMTDREPDAQKFINSIAQDADAERRLALRGR